jgi:D-alanyl-D-alanine dipeptidase
MNYILLAKAEQVGNFYLNLFILYDRIALQKHAKQDNEMKNILSKTFIIVMTVAILCLFITGSEKLPVSTLPDGFVYVKEVIPSVVVEMRYYGTENFVGEQIDGYQKPRPILTRQAAAALKGVQEDLQKYALSLKIFDAYRPQQAVDHFVRWAENHEDIRMKSKYYPDVDKKNLFRKGYIARRSGHSRGSTVDVTIVSFSDSGEVIPLDMGTPFDFFGPSSASEYAKLMLHQRLNRLLLRTLMEKHGFKHLSEEWWHFTLKNEPFPKTYFNFPIQ